MPADTHLTFTRPDGQSCPAYYAAPPDAGEGGSAVVLLQEWWGINDQIIGVADRLVKTGHRVLVPDLYRGRLALDAAEALHRMQSLDFVQAAAQDIPGAVNYLKADLGARVATLGFCMGGGLSLRAAISGAGAEAAVTWYGIPPDDAGDFGAIDIPVQGHFGLQDEAITPARVDEVEQRFRDSGVDYEFFRYDAPHAFGNETGDNYAPGAARQAWDRTLQFLEKHL